MEANTSSAKGLGKDLTHAPNSVAAEAPGNDHEPNNSSRQRQISHMVAVMSVHRPGTVSHDEHRPKPLQGRTGDSGSVIFLVSTLDNKPAQHQTGAANDCAWR
jgi:hypothetical protein